MKLKPIRFECLKGEKSIAFSDRYVIICTGRRAIICSRTLNILKEFDGLHYVYSAYISPDEKCLLLISSGNQFYTVNLDSFEIKAHTVTGVYSGNLEGLGCWSFDGKSFFLIGSKKKDSTCAAIQYAADTVTVSKLHISEKYSIFYIKPIKEAEKYIAIALDLSLSASENESIWRLIKFDENAAESFPITELNGDHIRRAHYDPIRNSLEIFGGRLYISIPFGEPKADIIQAVEDIVKSTALKISDAGAFNSCCMSSDQSKIYIATDIGLFIWSIEEQKILAHKMYKCGVLDVKEINDKLIMISTINGIKTLELLPD